jgi:hypothetical protein
MSSWRETIGRSDLDLESVVGSFFPGDSEFTKAVSQCIDGVVSSGDIHKWAELKRLDAHAAKHGKIQPEQLLNMASMLMNRLCCFNGFIECSKFSNVLYDRIENFHNQSRDEIPVKTISSQNIPKYTLLYSYNVKTYASILELVATFLSKADPTTRYELGKRIAANHNHWFHFGHMIEFLKSIMDQPSNSATPSSMFVSLSGYMFEIVAGMCGLGVYHDGIGKSTTLLEQTGVTSSGWIGNFLIDCLEFSMRDTRMFSGPISACLNALSACVVAGGSASSVMDRVVEIIITVDGLMMDQEIACEILNFMICAILQIPVSQWSSGDSFSQYLCVRLVRMEFGKLSERFKTLVMKWFKINMLGERNHPGTVYIWKCLLTMDSPVWKFVVDCIGTNTEYSKETAMTCYSAVEVVRVMFERDGAIDAVVAGCLTRLALNAFSLRKCRKSVAYILHQCVIRNRDSVLRILYHQTSPATSVTENIARMLLDARFEEELDLFSALRSAGGLAEVELESVYQEETKIMGNFSNASLISMNSVVETHHMYKLESVAENAITAPPNDRLDRWIVPNNIFCGLSSRSTSEYSVVFHEVSGRLMALAFLFESNGVLMSNLLGLVETATGVLNNDLEKNLVAIDALFLILDNQKLSTDLMTNLEYLFALRVVADGLDDPSNRFAILQFIQFRWSRRFSVLRTLLDDGSHIQLVPAQVACMFRIIAVEQMAANQVDDTDAEHVINMKQFGEAFITADMNKGSFAMMDFVVDSFLNRQLIVPDIPEELFVFDELVVGGDERNLTVLNSQTLIELVDSFVALIVQWAEKIPQNASPVIQALMESVDPQSVNSDLFTFCFYSRLLPQFTLLISNCVEPTNLAFCLRLAKHLTHRVPGDDNPVIADGITKSLCFAIHPFIGRPEVWMIENDKNLLAKVVNTIFHFTFVVTCKDVAYTPFFNRTAILAVSTLASFVSTERDTRHGTGAPTVDIVKSLISDKFKLQFTNAVKLNDQLRITLNELQTLVENEILHRELGI